ncbi:LysR family transcriptional regulator [Vibrio salinus]|uniref:LysR family transcriptional regulator n=1 Tax=Vibrio salinus TaxID=2899784 RepID=UPI001E39F570|nr:LysR family transcriptional regulator [Vibrio salinus]MCE0494738.1 LysR family transcriptional regulator [Vibrio salinus]
MLQRASQMYMFHILETTGSFTKAAAKLDVSTSHVSKQLTLLENELGIQLVQRTTRNLILTEEGRKFAAFCTQIFDSVQNAQAQITDDRDHISGTVKLALSRSFGTLHVIPVLDRMQKRYRTLNFEITLYDQKVNMLEEDIDLWITTHESLPDGYVAQRITDTNFVLCAAPDYLEANSVPHHPNDLLNHNCIIYHSKESSFGVWPFRRGPEQVDIHVSGNYRVDLSEAVRDAVIAGRGIGYIATYLLSNEFEEGKLIQLLPDWKPTQELPVYAVYPRRRHLPLRLSTLISSLKEHIGSPSYWDKQLDKWVRI